MSIQSNYGLVPTTAIITALILFVLHYSNASSGERKTEQLNEKLLDAAKKGKLDDVKSALENGADVKATDQNGWTALHKASNSYYPDCQCFDIVKYLVENQSIIIDAKNKDGETALMRASRNCKADIVEYLLQRKANADVRDERGWTSLHWATLYCCQKGDCFNIVRLLVENGTDVNAITNGGSTALIFASYYDRLDIIEFLVDEKADVKVQNSGGETAMNKAYKMGNSHIVDYLRRMGATH